MDKIRYKNIKIQRYNSQPFRADQYAVNLQRQAIVEKINGGMLFHPDEQEGTSHAEALKLFTLNEDGDYTGWSIVDTKKLDVLRDFGERRYF